MQNAILTYFYLQAIMIFFNMRLTRMQINMRLVCMQVNMDIYIYVIMEHIDANLQFNDVDILHVSITLSLALIILLYAE